MKVVINSCFGGFGLSYEGVMKYAELSGFELYPFVEERDANGHIDFANRNNVPYIGQKDVWLIHYTKKPLVNGKYEDDSYFSERDIPRNDENLVKAVEQLKGKANGMCAKLEIVEIPDDVEWEIDEYDGNEHIAEKHRTWG